jgi:hypothetical protein
MTNFRTYLQTRIKPLPTDAPLEPDYLITPLNRPTVSGAQVADWLEQTSTDFVAWCDWVNQINLNRLDLLAPYLTYKLMSLDEPQVQQGTPLEPQVQQNIKTLLQRGYPIADYSDTITSALTDPLIGPLNDLIRVMLGHGLSLISLLVAVQSRELRASLIEEYRGGQIPFLETDYHGNSYFEYLIHDQLLEELRQMDTHLLSDCIWEYGLGREDSNLFDTAVTSRPIADRPDCLVDLLEYLKSCVLRHGRFPRTLDQAWASCQGDLNRAFFLYLTSLVRPNNYYDNPEGYCYFTPSGAVINWFTINQVPCQLLVAAHQAIYGEHPFSID